MKPKVYRHPLYSGTPLWVVTHTSGWRYFRTWHRAMTYANVLAHTQQFWKDYEAHR